MNSERQPKKRAYEKPRVIHREKLEVLSAVCDSGWVPRRTCMTQGQSGCQKTRF